MYFGPRLSLERAFESRIAANRASRRLEIACLNVIYFVKHVCWPRPDCVGIKLVAQVRVLH